jgi:hypothetical protein
MAQCCRMIGFNFLTQCVNEGRNVPTLSAAAKGYENRGDYARLTFELPLAVCDDHASLDINFWIGDEGWQQIVNATMLQGLAEPSRPSLQVDGFRRTDSHEPAHTIPEIPQ